MLDVLQVLQMQHIQDERIVFLARTALPTYPIWVNRVTIIHPVPETTNLCVFLNFSLALTFHIQSPHLPVLTPKMSVKYNLSCNSLAMFHLNSFSPALPTTGSSFCKTRGIFYLKINKQTNKCVCTLSPSFLQENSFFQLIMAFVYSWYSSSEPDLHPLPPPSQAPRSTHHSKHHIFETYSLLQIFKHSMPIHSPKLLYMHFSLPTMLNNSSSLKCEYYEESPDP